MSTTQITVLVIGRKLSIEAQALADQYVKRLQPWASLEVRLLAPSKSTGLSAIEDESKRLMASVKRKDYVIVLDERGVQYANIQLANHLAKVQEYMKRIVIIVGGAHGVSQELRERAQMVWSLSFLVFPHELVRIILTEQLYRTFAILNNHPYHHG